MERVNHSWANYEDYVKSHDRDDQEKVYHPRYDANPDYDDYNDDYEEEEEEEEEEDYTEGFQEQVEHETDYAADDSADFDGQFGWRSKVRRGKRGGFVPPDTRSFVAPVFVRVADLKAGATSGSGEERTPGA